MAAFVERLGHSTIADNGMSVYVRTHPLTTERIADMEDCARRVPYRQPRQAPEYAFERARARVLQVNFASEYREVASRLKAEIADQTALNPAANWYGIALAQSLMDNYDAADNALARSRQLFEGEEASGGGSGAGSAGSEGECQCGVFSGRRRRQVSATASEYRCKRPSVLAQSGRVVDQDDHTERQRGLRVARLGSHAEPAGVGVRRQTRQSSRYHR